VNRIIYFKQGNLD